MTATYPEVPGAKVGGTSQQAAEAAQPRAQLLRTLCLSAVRTKPMTADECAETIGESVLSVRPRFSELRALGKIEDTGVRRANASTRSANVWRSTELL